MSWILEGEVAPLSIGKFGVTFYDSDDNTRRVEVCANNSTLHNLGITDNREKREKVLRLVLEQYVSKHNNLIKPNKCVQISAEIEGDMEDIRQRLI